MDKAIYDEQIIKSLTKKKILLKSMIWNFLGKVLPLGIAVFTIPLIIKGLGSEKFGILTLIWAVIGYANLFDLGIGRALTQLISKKIGENDTEDLPTVIWTSVLILFFLSIIGSLVLSLGAHLIAQNLLKVSPKYLAETVSSVHLLSFCLPVFFVSGALGGILASYQKFGVANIINVPLAMFNFVAPILILPFTHRLDIVVASLVIGRLVSMVLTFFVCSKIVNNFFKIKFELNYLKKLLKFGGWLTVSNIISPIMVNFDRFFIANILSASMVAYYTTPYEVVFRLLIIPASIVAVLFPAFSVELTTDLARAKRMYFKGLKYIFLLLSLPALLIFFGAKIGLSLWISPEFADKSCLVAKIMAIGIVINGLSFLPSTLIQARGRSDITAKFHLIELPFYIILLVVLIKQLGVAGASLAWTIRVSMDFILLYFYSNRNIFNEEKTYAK